MKNLILSYCDGPTAILTLNRPEKLNALNYATNDALLDQLDRIEADDTIRAVILTGAGRAFSAGGDIPEFTASLRQGADIAMRDFVRRGQRMTARIEAFPKPFIVAVNGLAYGGGCEITEAAHLAIASEHARFAKPEVAIGIPPTFGGTQRLPRLAGRKRALELLLTGDSFSADHALAIGLVNTVVPHAKLLEAARALAEKILRHSPQTIARILSAATRGLNVPISEGLKIEQEQFAIAARSGDTLEGLSAWIDRRSPVYSGG
jgi:enoyl-CoA hydratase